jgi:hypothetical protein
LAERGQGGEINNKPLKIIENEKIYKSYSVYKFVAKCSTKFNTECSNPGTASDNG